MIARVSGVSGEYRIRPRNMGFKKDQIKAPEGVLTKSRNNDTQKGAMEETRKILDQATEAHLIQPNTLVC